MAAVMLAGAPLCNEAYAFGTIEATTAAQKLALGNGVKFILDLENGKFRVVTNEVTVKETGATYKTRLDDQIGTSAAKATEFEVVNFQKNALGATFNLKVEGKLFALTTDAAGTGLAMLTENTEKDKVYTTFTASLGAAGKYLFNETKLSLVAAGGKTIEIGGVLKTTKLSYDVDDLNSFSKTGTTFSFGTEAVEGNIFASLTPITLGGKVAFVKDAKQEDIVKFQNAYNAVTSATPATPATKEQKEALEAAAKKLTFAAVTTEAWGLNTSTKDKGEGYKLALVNGAAFHGEKALSYQNAQFTITEGDQLNNTGEVEIAANVTISKDVANKDVVIKAVKASNSDPKTYVTTIAKATNATAYAKMINPTMGGNTYFAASEFLKKDGISAYNVYFTSGEKSNANTSAGATEYHKYLAAYGETHYAFNTSVTSNPVEYTALAADDIDLSNPAAQWIVTGFDGKYTLTLTNRAYGNRTLTLKLGATEEAAVYDVDNVNNSSATYVNVSTEDDNSSDYHTLDLAAADEEFQIKLVPTTVSKHDGFMQLSKADREEGLKLSFSGKSTQLGEQTYYAEEAMVYDHNTRINCIGLIPNKDASKATALTFNEYEPSDDTEAANYINVTDYIYLNAAGEMAAAKDTLAYPAYTISKTTINAAGQKETKYLNEEMKYLDTAADANKFVIAKALNGTYQLVTNQTYAPTPGASATRPVAVSTSAYGFYPIQEICMAYPEDNTELAIVVNDNSDKTTLPAVSRHATFENSLGSVSMQENKNGILEGILAAEPATFWLDTADSEKITPSFYISKGIKAAEETKAYSDEVRNFLVYAPDSAYIFNEGSATETTNKDYILEGTSSVKAFFHPAALIAEDTMTTVVDGKEVTVVTKDADKAKNQINALKNFQFGICLADEEVADEYVIYSKADSKNTQYLYSQNGKLGFTTNEKQALVVKLGEGDATANEAIAAENVAVIAGEGVVTVKGAAGKQVVVSNILGQVIANKVATSDEETIAVAAGVAVVVVDGEATKVVVK